MIEQLLYMGSGGGNVEWLVNLSKYSLRSKGMIVDDGEDKLTFKSYNPNLIIPSNAIFLGDGTLNPTLTTGEVFKRPFTRIEVSFLIKNQLNTLNRHGHLVGSFISRSQLGFGIEIISGPKFRFWNRGIDDYVLDFNFNFNVPYELSNIVVNNISKTYINGTLVDSRSVTLNNYDNEQVYYIGRDSREGSFFTGEIYSLKLK